MKEIEIPFGAHDSELKGWEYTIPEGMEAEIKDGKIVVREKESEDERIRKFLITIVNNLCAPNFKDVERKDVLAYLEKQKESLHISETCKENAEYFASQCGDNRFELIDKAKRDIIAKTNIESRPEEMAVLDNILYRCWQIGWLGKYDVIVPEQKPAEWKPQPESLEALMYAIEGKWDMISPTSYLSRRLEDLYEGLVNTYNVDESLLAELPKTAYTAKDIEELKALKDKIDASMDKKSEERFKEAREKYQVEWSEDDEAAYDAFMCEVVNEKMNPTIEQVNWLRGIRDRLKSLRPSWKPSEEQMKALERTIRLANFGSEENRRKALESLHDQLEKLTQEG